MTTSSIRRPTNDREALRESLLEETKSICRIPAPTFAEGPRARYIHSRLTRMGLKSVEIDELHNVSAVLPGEGGGPTIMVAAHIDTVFPKGTDVEPRWDGRYWRAPGIRDNSASAAITLLLPDLLRERNIRLQGDLILAFSVGEEGLGDLRGMRALMDRFGTRVTAVLVADGNLGVINNVGISVRRLSVTVTAEGGHSWADAGKPSAVHQLAIMAAEMSRLTLPTTPKTALNIGVLNGGTSVNAIAQKARLELDLRSVDRAVVQRLEAQVRHIVEAASRPAGVETSIAVIGDRPGGQIAPDHPLVGAIMSGYAAVSVSGVTLPGSTDANIPLSLGIPAASMGLSAGGGIHTLDEFLDPETLPVGAEALLAALVTLQRLYS